MHFDVYPAGDVYLTAEDMARYLGAQLNGGVFNGNRILSAESVREMHTPRLGTDYGFGLWIVHDSATGHTLIEHGGAILGQRAYLIGDLDARVGVYYMTNADNLPDEVAVLPSGVVPMPLAQSEIVYAALKLLRGENYVPRPQPKVIAVNDKVLDSYVGTYQLGQGTLVVSRIGRALGLQQNGQTAINELLAETPVRFHVRGSNTTITFQGDGGGIDRLVLEAGAQHRTATRRQ